MRIPLLSLLCSFTCHHFFPRSPFLAVHTPKYICILAVLHLHLHCTRSELQPVSSSSLMPVVSLVKMGPPILKLQWGSGDTDQPPHCHPQMPPLFSVYEGNYAQISVCDKCLTFLIVRRWEKRCHISQLINLYGTAFHFNYIYSVTVINCASTVCRE